MAKNKKESKFVRFLEKLHGLKYKYLIYIPVLFILIFILYAIFTANMTHPDPARIEEINAITPEQDSLNALFKYYREIDAKDSYIAIKVFTGVVIFILFGLTIYLSMKYKRKKWYFITLFILLTGFSMRIMYAIYTNALLERQHDVLSIRNMGHYAMIMSYYKTGVGPAAYIDSTGNVNLAFSYQLYHPRFSHLTLGYFMRFTSLFFGKDEYVLYQSTRILLIFTSILAFFFGYLTLKELFNDERATAFGTSILAFSPIFYRLSAMTNNDNFATMFTFAAVYFTVKWFKTRKMPYIIGIAFSIGLGMASKLSAALISIPIGIIFIYVLVKEIRDAHKMGRFTASLRNLIIAYVVFVIICFPLGLYYPIKHKIEYDQPLTYVFKVGNKNLFVVETNFFKRFLSFSFADYFKYPYIRLSAKNSLGQDYNVEEVLLKSISYGEFNYKYTTGAQVINGFALVAYLVVICSFMVTIYFYFEDIYKRNRKKNHLLLFLSLSILFVMQYSYTSFNVKHPATCTMDFRYVVPVLISYSLFTGFTFAKLSNSRNPKYQKVSYLFALPFVLYFVGTIIFYFVI